MLANREEISQIIRIQSGDLFVHPSFIEKDWYAMRIMGELAKLEHPTLQLVFSGGTSLSKGFGLIERFSEDLDFKVLMPDPPPTRSQRSSFRKQVLAILQEGERINIHILGPVVDGL